MLEDDGTRTRWHPTRSAPTPSSSLGALGARGRLSLEEFEPRGGGVRRAHREVERLLADLARRGDGRDAAAPTARQGGAARRAGIHDQAMLEARPERVHGAVLDSLAPALNRYGYELRQSDANLIFERRGRPRWVPFVSRVRFPGRPSSPSACTRPAARDRDQRARTGRNDPDRLRTAPRAIRKAFGELADS